MTVAKVHRLSKKLLDYVCVTSKYDDENARGDARGRPVAKHTRTHALVWLPAPRRGEAILTPERLLHPP
jgi:hypothetical protein